MSAAAVAVENARAQFQQPGSGPALLSGVQHPDQRQRGDQDRDQDEDGSMDLVHAL